MKKKVITITFLLFYCFMFIFSETFYGEGTSESPYLISTYLDLEQLRNYVNSDNKEYSTACYRQTCDIVFPDGIKWNPIGKLQEGILFSGEYNGDGHTISNINCVAEYASVFEFLGGIVYNLGIENGCFKGDYTGSRMLFLGINEKQTRT